MMRRPVVFVTIFLLIAFVLAVSAMNNAKVEARVPAQEVPSALVAAADESAPQHYSLGNGRYMAIIPAVGPQDTYSQQPYIDTYVASDYPGTSYCTAGSLQVEYNGLIGRGATALRPQPGEWYHRAYLGFHLSSIPSNATVTSATLYTYLYEAGGTSSVFISLRRVTSPWSCPLYWSTQPASAGYTGRSVGTNLGWKTWSITSLVQNYWLGRNFGTSPNYGLQLRGPETGGISNFHWRYFRSKNASSGRPYLVVVYEVATPTPTPTSTRTPTPTPTPTPTTCSVTFAGHVYEGAVGDTSRPLGGVRVQLLPSDHSAVLATVRTGADGTYRLSAPNAYAGYHIVETDPAGYISAGARAGSGGWVYNPNGIAYGTVSCGTYGGNEFWDSPELACEFPLVVNHTDDVDDGACNGSHCSLREAILCANSHAGPDTISFDIPRTDPGFSGAVWVISPDSALPTLSDDGTTVDGPSQTANQGDTNPDGPEIVVSGVDAGSVNGFSVTASNSVIRGLNIGDFALSGIFISGEEASNNVIERNYIGVAANGTARFGNNRDGVNFRNGPHDNTIGPDNVISGNTNYGITLGVADNNTIRGNLIGLNRAGSAAIANGLNGIDIAVSNGTLVEGNVISGNGANGLQISQSSGVRLVGNLIGLNQAGTTALPNAADGVAIENGSTNVTIGGRTAAQRNIISGNGRNGIGIKDPSTSYVAIVGNYIGTNAAGIAPPPVPNRGHGIYLFDGAHHNTIGPDNLIAYNTGDGVRVDGEATLYNTITQNGITSNGGLGIENINGGNTELPPPVITGVGSVEGTACPNCTVEVFSDTDGEGGVYEGTTTADAAGNWTWPGTARGPFVTATSTDGDGNTSEFPGTPVHFFVADVEVDKDLTEPPGGVAGVGQEIGFRVTIRNTGDTTLTEVQVTDRYREECLEFVTSDPLPDRAFTPPFDERRWLVWYDITDHFGDLDPGDEVSFPLTFRAAGACALALNCIEVGATDEFGDDVSAEWCEDFTVEPGPPEIEISKLATDPEVCVGDEVLFGGLIGNSGPVPVSTLLITDTYDTRYLTSLNDPAMWGPDDGELVRELDMTAMPLPPSRATSLSLRFLAEAPTDSTVDEVRAMANDDPATERSDTETVTILSEPGPCLVVNGDFETGDLTGWMRVSGNPQIVSAGRTIPFALFLGLLPPDDALVSDVVYQSITIPADAHSARLSFWVNVNNEDDEISSNWFGAVVIDESDAHYRLIHTGGTHGWQQVTYDLTPFIGQTILLVFGTSNNGDGVGPLWAYVDDVEICVSTCGPAVPPSEWTSGLCWKPGNWPDYAPSGVPDFDQRGYTTDSITRTVDGPVAAANSLWWFDSRFEPGATPPPDVSDGYPLLEAYGAWDDHDARNVSPFILDLAGRMHTDGLPRRAGDWVGTRPDDLANGLRDLLEEKELLDDYSVTLEETPSFDRVRDEILRNEDVLLLLGFWEYQPEGWRRLGGHWVTATGVDCMDGRRLGISDPFIDSAESGYPGLYLPTTDHEYPHDERVHDDAINVSHDLYEVGEGRDVLELVNYVRWDPAAGEFYPDLFRFWGANTPLDLEEDQAEEYQGGPVKVYAEYMVALSPLADTVTLSLVPSFVESSMGEVFSVDVMAESRTQPFDTVQVYLGFDPTRLQVVDESGNPVTQTVPISPTMVLQNEVDNTAGQVNYAARVPLGDTPLTGRVRVTRLYFQAIATTPAAGTQVEFNWTNPRRTDVLSGITSVLGRIRETRVRTSEPATIRASVTLEGRSAPPHEQWEIPLTVELRDPASNATVQVFGVTTDDQGRFAVEGVTPGTYDLRVKGMHTLANRRTDLTLATGDNTVDMGTLLEGDADNDNDVDATDASLVNVAFGSVPGHSNWDPRADLNEDGLVNGVDMGLLAANFGRAGDIEVGPSSLLVRPSSPAPRVAGGASPLTFYLPRSTAPVTMAFSPTPIAANVGDTFSVDVVLHAGTQPVDTVEVHIVFPAGTVQVVDDSGSPATAIQGGSAFDLELTNRVDRTTGLIHYAATMLGGSLSGDITVATLRLRAVGPAADERLRFSVWPPYKSNATYRGRSVLTSWPAAQVVVTGHGRRYLPFLLKKGTGGTQQEGGTP